LTFLCARFAAQAITADACEKNHASGVRGITAGFPHMVNKTCMPRAGNGGTKDRRHTMSIIGKLFGYIGQVPPSTSVRASATTCPSFSSWYSQQLAKSYEDMSQRR
jgi:hypothetical protein